MRAYVRGREPSAQRLLRSRTSGWKFDALVGSPQIIQWRTRG